MCSFSAVGCLQKWATSLSTGSRPSCVGSTCCAFISSGGEPGESCWSFLLHLALRVTAADMLTVIIFHRGVRTFPCLPRYAPSTPLCTRALQDWLMRDLPLRHTLAGFNKVHLGADFVIKRCCFTSSIHCCLSECRVYSGGLYELRSDRVILTLRRTGNSIASLSLINCPLSIKPGACTAGWG
jgi:hypothetical protein